jgi:hypothetical protein
MPIFRRSVDHDGPDAPIFAGISERERRSIVGLGTDVNVDAGTTLTPEGRPGRSSSSSRRGRQRAG